MHSWSRALKRYTWLIAKTVILHSVSRELVLRLVLLYFTLFFLPRVDWYLTSTFVVRMLLQWREFNSIQHAFTGCFFWTQPDAQVTVLVSADVLASGTKLSWFSFQLCSVAEKLCNVFMPRLLHSLNWHTPPYFMEFLLSYWKYNC